MSALTGTGSAPEAKSIYSRKNPFMAELTGHDRLTRPGSLKDTRHFVMSLAGSGLTYAPGDSLGAFGRNSPHVVDELLGLLEFDPETPIIDPRGQTTTLRATLLLDYTINRSNRKVISGIAQRVPQGEQRNRIMEIQDNSDVISNYIDTRDYVDILKEFTEARFETPESFLSQLTPVTPRLYSIASAQAAHRDEVHLCVAIVRYDTHGRPKKGLASGFLADHAEMFVKDVPVYVQESRTFRLPANPATNIIMVGPGTGIAPFRAFLEQRTLEGAPGQNWLFFGEQHRATDFLYEEDWIKFQKAGKLHRFDCAFSRDQEHKIYVQTRMLEHSKDLWAWLQNGAYFYVCGDAKNMAKGVHKALIDIAAKEGGLSPEAAAEYVNVTLMKTEKRYLRDVY